MDRCLVINNSSSTFAGAISSAGNAGINRITNSTIVGNSGGGAAVEAYNASGLEVINSIIWGNQSADGAHIYLSSGSEIILNYNDIQSGLAGIIGFDDIVYNNNNF